MRAGGGVVLLHKRTMFTALASINRQTSGARNAASIQHVLHPVFPPGRNVEESSHGFKIGGRADELFFDDVPTTTIYLPWASRAAG